LMPVGRASWVTDARPLMATDGRRARGSAKPPAACRCVPLPCAAGTEDEERFFRENALRKAAAVDHEK